MRLWRRQQRRPSRPTIVLAAVAGAALAVAVILMAAVLFTQSGGQPDRTGLTNEVTSPSATPLAAGAASEAAPADQVMLPAASDQVDGYPVGFAHTDLGAVSALVEFNRAQIGFDYDQSAAIARLYSAPDDADAVEARANEAVANRRQQLGVPPTGDPAAPAAFALTPFAFTIDELDTDYYAVTVLSLATTTNTNGEVRNLYYSGTQLVCWISTGEGGDWKVAEPSADDAEQVAGLSRLPAVGPTNPQFADSGWIAVKTPTSRTATHTGADQ